eukprot:scaffold64691_cov23-Attheya_sp.AAC.1
MIIAMRAVSADFRATNLAGNLGKSRSGFRRLPFLVATNRALLLPFGIRLYHFSTTEGKDHSGSHSILVQDIVVHKSNSSGRIEPTDDSISKPSKKSTDQNKMPTRVTFRVKWGSSLPIHARHPIAKKQRTTNVPSIRIKSEIVNIVEEVTVKTEEIDGSTGELLFLELLKTPP